MIPRELLKKIRQNLPRLNRRVAQARGCVCLVIFFGWLLAVGRAEGTNWRAERLPQYDRLFQQTNGWIGADGDFAVTLTNGLTLWLFSDTFVGTVQDGHRVHATMVNNSAAWQQGIDPTNARVQFFYGHAANGKPAALITPADGKGWFWLYDGTLINGKLFLFLTQVEPTGEKSAFGFRHAGAWLGEVDNPLAPPPEWQVKQSKIPFAKFGADENCSFGSAVLKANGYLYIFGTEDAKRGGSRSMILARAPEADPANFSAWQFRTHDSWSTNAAAATGLCEGMATEYSVSWRPSLQQFVLIYTENGLSDKIIARTASEPWGPWSPPTVVYRCPEPGWSKQVFCYAAKAHPMLSDAPDELILTYAANSFGLAHALDDARLYWPRFVRLKSP